MVHLIDFFRYNREKGLTLKIWLLSAFFRLFILMVPAKKMKFMYGTNGGESIEKESEKNYKRAWKIGFHVDRIGEHTPWESKCLVRALTAHTLLHNEKITSTLYLGVKKEDEQMVAHAWVRSGELFVTGGDGSSYALVAKFVK